MQDFITYANSLGATDSVMKWLNTTLANYLKKNKPTISEVEHVIDYLVNNKIPKIAQMSYPQAVAKAEKWVRAMNKKGNLVEEKAEDVKVVHDFGDGFRIVQLVGENAYKREGYLMHHCVASYFGKDTKVYSLRDADNQPHCTMEWGKQIKGKGNGLIHPKYITYVVQFLKITGMKVGDSEMLNLGYVNVEKFKEDLGAQNQLFENKYWYKKDKLYDKNGKQYASLDMLDVNPLIDEQTLKTNYSMETFVPNAVNLLLQKTKPLSSLIPASGNSAQIAASSNYAQIAASGDSARLAASGDSARLAASGDSARLAASGNSAQIAASSNYAQIAASGDSAMLAASGDSARLAASGNSAQIAASGNYSSISAVGKHSVAVNIGDKGKISGVIGTWITLAEYNCNHIPICVRSAKIDGKKLKPGVFYTLKNRKFTEVK